MGPSNWMVLPSFLLLLVIVQASKVVENTGLGDEGIYLHLYPFNFKDNLNLDQKDSKVQVLDSKIAKSNFLCNFYLLL